MKSGSQPAFRLRSYEMRITDIRAQLSDVRRRRLARVLIAAGALFLLLGLTLIYTDRMIFNSQRFANNATTALRDDHVRTVLSKKISDQITKAAPDAVTAGPIIETVSSAIVGLTPFQSLFRHAVADLHRSMVKQHHDVATFAIADVGVLVSEAIRRLQPKLAKHIPRNLETKLANFSRSGSSRPFIYIGQEADRVATAKYASVVLALLLFGFAVLLGPRPRLRAKEVGFTIVAVAGLFLVFNEIGRLVLPAVWFKGEELSAVRAVWDAFFSDMRPFGFIVAAIGAVFAAVAGGLMDEGDVRSGADKSWRFALGRPQTAWARLVRAMLLVGTGMFIFFSPDTVVGLLVLAFGIYLTYVGVAELLRLGYELEQRGLRKFEQDVTAGLKAGVKRPLAWRLSHPRTLRIIYTGTVLAGCAALIAVAIVLLGQSEKVTSPINACNGSAALCNRPLDTVVFPSTHNSMSAARQRGWLFPNQSDGISDQLLAGIRGLSIDTHYGVDTPRGVATVLTPGSKSRAKLSEGVNPDFVHTAERLRARIGYRRGGKRQVFLCHGFCELGATDAVSELRNIHDFLIEKPNEVLIISIEDDITPQDTAAIFARSRLLDFVYKGALGPRWPTLREMIASGQRVIVMGENDTHGVVWYRPQFKLSQETPYLFQNPAELVRRSSCRPGRGDLSNPLFLLNNWVDTAPTSLPSNAAKVNAYPVLLGRARMCQAIRRRIPNMILVDHYRQGDVLGVAAALNGTVDKK